MDFKKFIEKLNKGSEKNSSDKKNVANLLIVLLVGVLMILTVSFFKTSNTMGSQVLGNGDNKNSNKSSKGDQQVSDDKTSQEYETTIQQKLKDTLEKIDGVGKTEVMVSFESGEEQIPAVNINDSTSNTEEKDTEGGTRNTTQKNNGSTVVITNEGDTSKPLIVKTYKPKVSGVCVVAEGAGNKVTELRITKAVTDLFNIPENKVNVYPMKK
ncbi:stage III sporulation protein AG [Clostridiaceae bacterium UIB06]|uniref:Stage III sporulation protein AG n=1 Tax=Clostridium thailandense TaxID=2794346 RepID=A0A949WSD6_9CLOT|nr:stage III sporulation protein AG [Clostridium thailandense]MBV7275060.1 stage III sporulation protein AG [Clostridium thailandense]MCH5136574.1 stage III sporulation protein AG [Clostridiaceae bacterium UIB06]